ncbi:5'-methylthioadenosine/S-adenosylhomocysteine nucleosidase [Caulobacter rhizosphaerae]|jgi:adenosylhomocysteine nucleosidase|uniref:Adenosylhomocysteine nucleosidase n=1 Tax=Caulobacter rhizosphaerae TaxID=2010972 RepID=A0ABU1N297_9CAUL|nr:5'-methylthioadenosine/S-adenosylhomocysteine nucleosidase [Caulobacter rhizosphaerae]MDR6532211.1 adenosylhomocysteine nucleosidase [Caulobacter rhizosphaerae]GGL21676.1 phosphorylase [Caulobacter rhizosphaerae]
MRLLLTLLLASAPLSAHAAEPLDPAPRTAVISAFPPELAALEAATVDKREYAAAGTRFVTGTLEGKPVVLFLSGISMVNAAMTTQGALDRFRIERIVFSGVAGGADPALEVGDVVAPERWVQSSEMAYAREVPGGFAPTPGLTDGRTNFGMMYPRAVTVTRDDGNPEDLKDFPVDPALLDLARRSVAGLTLKRCAADQCLAKPPKVVVGGVGGSGPVFVDNAAFRQYAHDVFGARVLDMESAAVAQVAYVNRTPFIAFRSLSDLAGGDPAGNQFPVFLKFAAENSATVVRAFVKALP